MNNSHNPQTSPSLLKGGDLILSKLEKIVQKFESECKAQQGTLVLKSSSDLQRLLISILNDILSNGFKLEQYKNQDKAEITSDSNFYSVYQVELHHLASIQYINSITSANTDKKRAFLWLLLELQGKTINLTLREAEKNQSLYACYEDYCLMKAHRSQLRKLITQLESVNYQIEGDIITRYKKFYSELEQKEIQQNKLKEQKEQEAQLAKTQESERVIKQQKEHQQIKQPQITVTSSIDQEPSQLRNIQPSNYFQTHLEIPNYDSAQKITPGFTYEQSSKEEPAQTDIAREQTWYTPEQKRPNTLLKMFKQTTQTPEEQYEQQSILPIHLTQTWKTHGKKPSESLYEEIYKDVCEFVHSKFQQKQDQTLTLKDQDHKCWSCQKSISTGFYQFGSNCEYCHYSGRWHCTECLSDQRTPIPWKALEQFDLKHYKVSLIAYQEIQKLYDVPMLEVDYNAQIVQKSKSLFEFMVLKRQIHLLYDMICDPNLVQSLLEGRINLCLKKNLFSLKNFYEIYNGSLYKLMEGYYNILCKHVLYCKSCQKRGSVCKICKSVSVVHAYDIRNITYCDKCKNLYHRACLEESNCPHCLVHNK